jgi:hypothetical protein
MKISLTPHQQKFFGRKLKSDLEDSDPRLEAELRHALRGPRKKYKPGHFAALVLLSGRGQSPLIP